MASTCACDSLRVPSRMLGGDLLVFLVALSKNADMAPLPLPGLLPRCVRNPLKSTESAEYTLLVFEKKNDSMAINYVLFVSKVSKIPSHI